MLELARKLSNMNNKSYDRSSKPLPPPRKLSTNPKPYLYRAILDLPINRFGEETLPINHSAMALDYREVEDILQRGFDPTKNDSRGCNALTYTMESNVFFSMCCQDDKVACHLSPEEREIKESEVLRLLLSHENSRKKINDQHLFTYYDRGTLLMAAAKCGNIHSVKVLLEFGASPNINVYAEYRTALSEILFAGCNYPEEKWMNVSILLLRYGASIEETERYINFFSHSDPTILGRIEKLKERWMWVEICPKEFV